jgi:ribonuclease HI
VAEYAGLLLALRLARRLKAREVELILDSNLIVEQLNGRWRVKDAKLRGFFDEAREILATFDRWSAVHEPRERNRAADALANLALDDPEAAAQAEQRNEIAVASLGDAGDGPAADGPTLFGDRGLEG